MRYAEIALRREYWCRSARAIGSAGERLVHTEEVTGSIPVSPTNQTSPQLSGRSRFRVRPFSILVQQESAGRRECADSSGQALPELPKSFSGDRGRHLGVDLDRDGDLAAAGHAYLARQDA